MFLIVIGFYTHNYVWHYMYRYQCWAYSIFTMHHQDFGGTSREASVLLEQSSSKSPRGRHNASNSEPKSCSKHVIAVDDMPSKRVLVELCMLVWACRQRNRGHVGTKTAWWTHSTRFIDLGFPPEMLIGFEPGSKKAHRFSNRS